MYIFHRTILIFIYANPMVFGGHHTFTQLYLSAMAESRAPQSTLAFHLWKDERFSARKIHPVCSQNASAPRVLQEHTVGQTNHCNEKPHVAIRSLANGDPHRTWGSTCTKQTWTCTKQKKAAGSTGRGTNPCLLREQPVQSLPVPCAGP